MSKVHIYREHELGIEKAREIAKKWQSDGEKDLSLSCDYQQGDDKDTINFKRSGVKGDLVVTATSFELNAKLGFLVAPFKDKLIEGANRSLDKLIDKA